MTKLKEKIVNEINAMNMNELVVVYEQIQLLQAMKGIAKRPETSSVETILEMTASCPGSWAEVALEERADRL
ncbi:hypothetical protein [Candidatus Electrothrix sp.]|uniref:hypothetical protein n=1 Tax=Candidatus Electrothrix sp. TaxID=2170559 RepID=UPI00405764EA